MPQNIVLIGMMGCGKSTVGELLAHRFDCPLVDTDTVIEERQGRSIPEIFAQEGEGYFRALELELCRELSGRSGLVIACGGGLPLQDNAIAALKENGVVFWLDRDPEETYEDLDVSGRPLAQGGLEDFVKRYEARAPVYKRWADHHLPCWYGPMQMARMVASAYTGRYPI